MQKNNTTSAPKHGLTHPKTTSAKSGLRYLYLDQLILITHSIHALPSAAIARAAIVRSFTLWQ